MKKIEAGSENRKVRTETLKPVVQKELDIKREVYEDGSVVYLHENEKGDGLYGPIDTYAENLYDTISTPMNKLVALINLLGDDEFENFGFIAESIVNEANQKYEELFSHLKRELGVIRVDTIKRGQVSYRSGRIAGIRIEPKEKAEEVNL